MLETGFPSTRPRRSLGKAGALLSLLCAVFLALGCRGGCSSSLAELTETTGQVDRDHSTRLNIWQEAKRGAEFFVGDGIRTGKDGKAVLKLDDGSEAALESHTLLRFLDAPPGAGSAIDVVTGEASLSVGEQGLDLSTSVGIARLEAKSRITLRREDNGVRFSVNVGLARFETKDGTVELGAGQGIEIGVGRAVLERFSTEPPPTPTTAAPAETAPKKPTLPLGLSIEGKGAKLRRAGESTFAPLAPGEHPLEPGSSLSLAALGQATATRGGRRVVLRGAGQFLLLGPSGSLVETQSGQVSVEGSGSAVLITVPGGTILTRPSGVADLRIRPDLSSVAVRAGEVEITTTSGQKETLRAGEEVKLSGKGTLEVAGRGPGYADILLSAGESIAIHDPSPPTAVGIRLGDRCREGGVVQLLRANGSVAASSRAEAGLGSVLVPGGVYGYRLRCLEPSGLGQEPVATGKISVRADSGTAQLPSRAPLSQVDTDGRKYTVLYQNLLPQLAVRWDDKAEAGRYKLTVSSAGRSESFQTQAPRYFFPSGSLPEGTHQLIFESDTRRSKPTTLTITFDNAAPTARITSPSDKSFAPGAQVDVSGVALPGWKVFVGGQELAMDSQQRFSGSVSAPREVRALAIRFAHPGRGVRHYLRRSAQ